MYPSFAQKPVRRTIYVIELDRIMYRSEERAIEPPATLRNQLWNLTGRSDWSDWKPVPRKIDET